MTKHILIFVILAVVFYRTVDTRARHALIAVTLFDTDCKEPFALQSWCDILTKHKLTVVILAVVFHRTGNTRARHALISVTLFDTDCTELFAIKNC